MSQSSGAAEQLPASLQRQIQVSAYVFAGCTAVFIWDILNNLRSDYALLFKHKVHIACLAYVVSRIGSLVYVLGFTIFASYPLHACDTAFVTFDVFYPFCVSASAFLFFVRVRAIYGGNRLVTAIFGCLWLAVLGSAITIPFGSRAVTVGDPPECIITDVKAFVGAAGFVPAVYDTLVFLTISYRLVASFEGMSQHTWGAQLRMLFRGAHLPAFSKALFEDGQMYYGITVVVNIAAALMVYIPTVSSVYHGFLVVPNVTLTSIMACRVYRNTKLGIMRGRGELTLPTHNEVGPSGSHTLPLSVVRFTEYNRMTGSVLPEGNGDGDSAADASGTLVASSKADKSTSSSGVH